MTTAFPPPTTLRATRGPVGAVVGDEIRRLQYGYLHDRPDAVATLARLRRGAGKDAAAIPDLWGLLDTRRLYSAVTLRQEAAERAVYLATTLWALHQQARSTGMHRLGGNELGGAVRRLMPVGEILEPIRKRFVRAGTAPTLDLLGTRLREITVLLRGAEITLDYALLADQLHRWQEPGGPDEVRRSWGRSFQAYHPKSAAEEASADLTDATSETDPKGTP